MVTTHQLVEQYVPLANKLAFQKKKKLPKFIDIEDLRSAAYLGLVEAANRFDPKLGIAFSTFAYPRVFGAIHDWLREQGWIKRGDLTPMISLDLTVDENSSLKDSVQGKSEGNLEECFDHITVSFDDHAKSVLRCYFIDEYSMKEVGERFGVTESRICQLIKSYKDRIRFQLSDDEEEELALAA